MLIKRRDFIAMSSLASASMMLPKFLKAAALPRAFEGGHKVLVVLQLSGGNDGLNTVIPIRNDIYFRERQIIGVKNALKLTDEAGIHPGLPYFKELFDNGELGVLNNVGYPNPDKSHFRSMDIWQSASKSNEFLSSGWIGRYLDEACYNCGHPTQALEINDMLSLALKGEHNKAFAFNDPRKMYQTSREAYFKKLFDNYDQAGKLNQGNGHGHRHDQNHVQVHDDETVDYLYQTLGATINNAGYIFEKSKAKQTDVTYPNGQLGKDFKTIASLIRSDINTKVYYLQVGSFDTHINQLQRQESLFKSINESVKAFVADLKKNGLFQDVLLMTFSEFGRRVAQNASNGTDHGTANQMFFVSGGLKRKGLLNGMPDLENLDDGNLKYTEDFRKVYATVLKKWLGAQPDKVLGWRSEVNGLYDFI